MTDELSEINLVTDKTRAVLGERQIESYREHRREYCEWMLEKGKHLGRRDGYSLETVKMRAYRLDRFYRMVWDVEDRYTEEITSDHADAFLHWLSDQDFSESYKASFQKALLSLFRWKEWKTDGNVTWDPDYRFSSDSIHNPRDILTKAERRRLREASLSYGSVPTYQNVTPEERTRWNRYLSKRFGKPMDEIGPDDWAKANSWKFTSTMWMSMDAGLRPKEVAEAKVSWIDFENEVLRIPWEESVKNEDNWRVSLLPKTTHFLGKWLQERQVRDKYEGSDRLWLTRYGNPYKSLSLNRLLRKLLDAAGIDTSDREITWYSIRHSVGTYMTREEDLKAAAAQLRHKSLKTTARYDQAPVEDRRDALERMG